ncbi:MAG: extensin family protein [Hyphomicrobium sp.]
MPRPRRRLSRLILLVTLPAAIVSAFWLGLVPQRLSPFAPLDLAVADPWFLDFRLAALKTDADLCAAVLHGPAAAASGIGDQPYDKGCGWITAVRMSEAGGARIAIDKLSCPMAAALAMWMEHEVQPAARQFLNARVTAVKHMGTYACRNIAGSKTLKSFRSQHASANAIDVAAFVLDDGRTVSLVKHWKGEAAEAQFLKAIHRRACRYFRVALGPNFNAAHANHFHLDRGMFKSCR